MTKWITGTPAWRRVKEFHTKCAEGGSRNSTQNVNSSTGGSNKGFLQPRGSTKTVLLHKGSESSFTKDQTKQSSFTKDQTKQPSFTKDQTKQSSFTKDQTKQSSFTKDQSYICNHKKRPVPIQRVCLGWIFVSDLFLHEMA